MTYGSLKPFLSFARRSVHPMTCSLKRTTGSSPGICENVFRPLPRPPETRAGSRETVRRARPPILSAFLGAGTLCIEPSATMRRLWKRVREMKDDRSKLQPKRGPALFNHASIKRKRPPRHPPLTPKPTHCFSDNDGHINFAVDLQLFIYNASLPLANCGECRSRMKRPVSRN
jgi:hypothetical protein